MGFGTPWKAALLIAVGAAGGAAAVAVASVPDSSGVIHACVATSPASGEPVATGPNLRVIDTSAGQACEHPPPGVATTPEQSITWNVTGPQGPPGTNGTNGAPGRSVTIVGGDTLTLPGGAVIHVGRSPGLTVASPPTSGKKVATLTFTGGPTIPILGFSIVPGSFAKGSGASTLHDVQVTRPYDKSSPKLALACAQGTHFKKATIVLGKGGKTVTYTMSDVIIASYQLLGGKGGQGPNLVDSLTLNYAKIAFKSS